MTFPVNVVFDVTLTVVLVVSKEGNDAFEVDSKRAETVLDVTAKSSM